MTSRKWPHFTLFPFILLLCLAILMSAFVGLWSASRNGTLYIADIEGDRSVLNDVVISGVLQDRYHGMKFAMRNHEVEKKFLSYESNEALAIDMSQQRLGNALIEDGIRYFYNLEYSISPRAKVNVSIQKGIDELGRNYEEKIYAANIVNVYATMEAMDYEGNKHGWGKIRFSPGAYIESDKQDLIKTERVNYDETGSVLSLETSGTLPEEQARINMSNPAFVILDGSVYFTLLSTSDFKGTNGIFKIEEFSYHWLGEQSKSEQYGKIKTLTTFSLDKHSITVLGLRAVNNRLVLILLEDGILKLQSFDPESGSMIDELDVMPLSEAESPTILQSFIQGNRLNLSISKRMVQGSETVETSILLVSIQIDGEMKLLHVVENLDLEEDESLLDYTLDQMYEVNGKLFVFANVMQGNGQRQYPYQELEPKHYLMFVYHDGKLLYKGELMNDSDEDYIADRQRVQAFGGGYGQNVYQYRQIRAVEVRGR